MPEEPKPADHQLHVKIMVGQHILFRGVLHGYEIPTRWWAELKKHHELAVTFDEFALETAFKMEHVLNNVNSIRCHITAVHKTDPEWVTLLEDQGA
jgi:hypothetical protein